VIYVELLKALYGTLHAARLFWEKMSGKLKEWGFVANPYDSCVVNKMINGKQCTVVWHVDDLKISHVEQQVVDDVVGLLDSEFGKEVPLSKSTGPVLEYLGIKFDRSVPGEVKVDIADYIKAIIAEMPSDMVGKAATPAGVTFVHGTGKPCAGKR
jgi:Reverse transcriptase (RNA-dependent DNA polymerase)